MTKSFHELKTELALEGEYKNPQQLKAIKDWCQKNVSSDQLYEGDPAFQYGRYMHYAEQYLDKFLPNIPKELNTPVAKFSDMNAVQYASYMGYDYYLKTFENDDSVDKDIFNSQTEYKMTPLHLAAVSGHLQAVKQLLSYGALPNVANSEGQFPVHSALLLSAANKVEMKNHRKTIYKLLLEKAPFTVNAVDKTHNNIMHLMASGGYDDLIKDLMSTQSGLAASANNYMKYPITDAILSQQFGAVKELLKNPAVASLKDAQLRTPLHYAAQYAGEEIVKACCEASDGVDVRETSAKTPLLIAAEAGNCAAMKTLLAQGADPLAVDSSEQNILHLAVLSTKADAVACIFDNVKSLNVNSEDRLGHTPLFYAQNPTQSGQWEQIEALLKNNGGVNKQGMTLTK